MRFTLGAILILTLSPQGTAPQAPVALCDLLRHSDNFSGKEVTVRGTYRYGFEWSELHCLDCLPLRIWLEFSDDMDHASEKLLKHIPKGAGIVNLTVQGIFESGTTYGHMNGYRFQLTARKVSNVVVLQKGMKSLAEEEKTEKKWACGGANPK
jgi:hypothetical protein